MPHAQPDRLLSPAQREHSPRPASGVDQDFGEEELPEGIEDGSLYIAVPHKNDFDLGRSLVFAFVDLRAPAHVSKVESFFRQRGAYSKLKMLLDRKGLLDHWHEYENAAIRVALTEWADEHGFVVVADDVDA